MAKTGLSSVAVAAARARMDAGRWRDAELTLAQAWAEAPSVAVACLLVRVRGRLDGRSAALSLAREASARFPDAVNLLSLQARLLEGEGRWDAAAECWSRVLALRPGDRQAHLGQIGARLHGLPPEAAARELGLLLLLPRLAAEPRLHALHGRLLEQAGRPAEALQAWRRAHRLAPGDARLTAAHVFALRRCGARAAAFPGLMALVEADPRQATVLASLVADARRLGKVPEARRLLVHLARRDPDLGHLWGWVRRLQGAPRTGRRGGDAR